MLRQPEPDLRSRWPYRHTVPAYTTLAHLVVAVDVMITRNYIGGFTWHVPRQRPDQDDTHYCGRCNQHKTTTEAPSRHQSVRLDSCYHCYVDRRQIPNHGITYCHVCHALLLCFLLKNKKIKLGYLYWECRAGGFGFTMKLRLRKVEMIGSPWFYWAYLHFRPLGIFYWRESRGIYLLFVKHPPVFDSPKRLCHVYSVMGTHYLLQGLVHDVVMHAWIMLEKRWHSRRDERCDFAHAIFCVDLV